MPTQPIERPRRWDQAASDHLGRAEKLVREIERLAAAGAVLSRGDQLRLAQAHATLALVPASKRPARLRGTLQVLDDPPEEPTETEIEAAVEAIHATRQLSSRQTAIAVLRAVQAAKGDRS